MPLRLLPLAIGPAILLPLAAYAFRHRRVRGALWYSLLLLAIALWSAAYAWELAAPDFAQKLLALRIKYIGVIALPIVWIGFVLDFVAREPATVRRVTRRMRSSRCSRACDKAPTRRCGRRWRSWMRWRRIIARPRPGIWRLTPCAGAG